jgi:hypothetical protein
MLDVVDSRTAQSGTPTWLIDLKAKAADMRGRQERPRSKAHGRWLGDFLDQASPSGLLPAEEKLVLAAIQGEACRLGSTPPEVQAFVDWISGPAVWQVVSQIYGQLPQYLGNEQQLLDMGRGLIASMPQNVLETHEKAVDYVRKKAGLSGDWTPANAGDLQKLFPYFFEYWGSLDPRMALALSTLDPDFLKLAADIVREQLAPEAKSEERRAQAEQRKKSLRQRIDAQPRVLRAFFDDELAFRLREPGEARKFAEELTAKPGGPRPRLDACLARYRRESWRIVDPNDEGARVRAGVLRFLALGGDESAPVHEKGIELHRAYIRERLDLSGCTVLFPMELIQCHFEAAMVLQDCKTKALNLKSSRVAGIEAEGAGIAGPVFLHDGFRCDGALNLSNTTIQGRFDCAGSSFRNASEQADKAAISCGGAEIEGDASFTGDFEAHGGVSLYGATVKGELDCSGGKFRNFRTDGQGVALNCAGAKLANVTLGIGFEAAGQVSFYGGDIKGNLLCRGGRFRNRTADGEGMALTCEQARISGTVFLDKDESLDKDEIIPASFDAEGCVRFVAATIEGALQLVGGKFDNAVAAKSDHSSDWTPSAADAINLYRAQIKGALWLGPHAHDDKAKATLRGSLSLAGAYAHELVDHSTSWPEELIITPTGNLLPAYIYLEGFTYDRFTGGGEYDLGTRKEWLQRQPPRHLGTRFKPQPFVQLIKIYRDMGLDSEARAIGKFKHSCMRLAWLAGYWHGWRDRPSWSGWTSQAAWPFAVLARGAVALVRSALRGVDMLLWGFGAGYGYGWLRLIVFLVVLWGMSAYGYRQLAMQGGIAPSSPAMLLDARLRAACGSNWTNCPSMPRELSDFNPEIYSLEILFPALDLGQRPRWQTAELPGNRPFLLPVFNRDVPIPGSWITWLQVIHRAVSWGIIGLVVAMLSGLLKRD